MDLKQLEYFMTIADAGQITIAAEKLHMAQPPLSRSLQKLEEELGVILFKRTNKGIELTNAGLALYEKSKFLIYGYQEMVTVVKETAAGICGIIKIGTGYPMIPLLADKISQIRKQYPLVEFQITQGSPDELMWKLKNGNISLLFSPHVYEENSDFENIPLEDDPLVLVVHKDLDPSPYENYLTIDQLKGIPLCMMQNGDFYGFNEILIAECQKHGFTPNIFCQCNSTSAAITLVAKGLGLSYQPKNIVDTLKNPDIYAKYIENFHISMQPAILLNKNIYLPSAVKMFLSLFDTKQTPPETAVIEKILP